MRTEYRASLRCCIRFFIFFLVTLLGASLVWAQTKSAEPLSGVKEGWGYPVVVIPPQKGWDSADGRSIKLALRLAEHQISAQREGIEGREVTFMFASMDRQEEVRKRLPVWKQMKVAVILSFAGGGATDQTLHRLCAQKGPAVLFAEGENIGLLSADASPLPYVFALELPFFFKANAFAERATKEKLSQQVTLFSDVKSTKIARGARLNESLLLGKKIPSSIMWVPAYQQDHFTLAIDEADSGKSATFISWLEGMGTLSIWKKLNTGRLDTRLWYAGKKHPILLDAAGLVLADKDVLLERDIKGQKELSMRIRDLFNRVPENPVIAAKAYALGMWAIKGYQAGGEMTAKALTERLALVRQVPLMGEFLDIDPSTHRPISRRVGFLKIADRKYKSDGSVSVFSRNVAEK